VKIGRADNFSVIVSETELRDWFSAFWNSSRNSKNRPKRSLTDLVPFYKTFGTIIIQWGSRRKPPAYTRLSAGFVRTVSSYDVTLAGRRHTNVRGRRSRRCSQTRPQRSRYRMKVAEDGRQKTFVDQSDLKTL